MAKGSKVLRCVKFVLTNASFVLAVVMLVFMILDRYNPMIGFMDSPFSTIVLGLLVLCVLVNSLLLIICFSQKGSQSNSSHGQ